MPIVLIAKTEENYQQWVADQKAGAAAMAASSTETWTLDDLVAKGESVGYGRTWTALRDTVLGVIPVGYADGYSRVLGNRSHAAVRGRAAPVVGRVCMNILMIDVTDIPGVEVGDDVTLLGSDGDISITAEDLAGLSGTINYEFLARLSPAIPRFIRP